MVVLQCLLLQTPGSFLACSFKHIKIWVLLQCLQIYLIRYTSETRLKHKKTKQYLMLDGKIRIVKHDKTNLAHWIKNPLQKTSEHIAIIYCKRVNSREYKQL